MRQWTGSVLLQVMACRLFGANQSPEQMLTYCQLNPRHNLQWNSTHNTKFFIHENAFENVVCEMVVILSRGGKLKGYWIPYLIVNASRGTHKQVKASEHNAGLSNVGFVCPLTWIRSQQDIWVLIHYKLSYHQIWQTSKPSDCVLRLSHSFLCFAN